MNKDFLKSKTFLNVLTIVLIVIILISAIFIMLFYFQVRSNECIKNPLVYGAKQLTEKYGFEFFGSGNFLVPGTPNFHFDSKNLTIETVG